jgi:predicted peptidase
MRKEWLFALGGMLSAGVGGSSGKGNIQNRVVKVGVGDFDYQIYTPAKVQENLPVIIFLHGIGQRGTGGFVPTEGMIGGVVRHYFSQIPPAIILLPQCRPGVYWSDPVMEEMTIGALDQTINEFGADNKRIYLSGVSMGGYGVWSFAMAYPDRFTGLVSICGGSPILSGDRFTPIAEKVGKTPAWLFHGADDRIVPPSESRYIVQALKKREGNVKYNEYPRVGHEVWLNVLSEKELMPWLLAQKRA